jgi:hypothetical protein
MKDGTIKEFGLFDYERLWFRAMTQPAFLNARSPTLEEEHYFNQKKVDAELKSKSKNETIGAALQ